MTWSTRRRAVAAAAAAVLLAGCSGPATGAPRSGTTTTAPADAAAGGPGAATTAPTVTHRMERVTVAGTAIEVAIVEPDGFRDGEVHPVLLALPPGGQDRQTTEKVVDAGWREESEKTAAALRALGGSVSIDVVAGDDHFLRSLPNAAVFERLESFRHPRPLTSAGSGPADLA